MTPVSPVALLVGLIAVCIALAVAARRAEVPYAVALVLGGMALAFIPAMPRLELEPHLALALFLPPLLQASAYRTDWPAFRSSLRPILLLALGAVLFTAAAVAVTAHALDPALPWGACVALGAIVAPPDAVAATAVLKTTHIPRRVTVILEGESLLNDASSLILYRAAIVATTAGGVSLAGAGGGFVLSSLGGAAIGYAVGRATIVVARALGDTALEIAAIVLAGFVGYFAAELLSLSGVLAAVVCGLVIGRHQHEALSARTRVESIGVWNFIEFVLTSLIFILIGLQLSDVVDRLGGIPLVYLGSLAVLVPAALIASRFAWVFATAYGTRLLPQRLRPDTAALPASHLAVISWAGMRGVVSLAAALALPEDFPGRDVIVFLAFCAILVTLVLQGTTLGWVIQRLGVVEPAEHDAAFREATVRAAASAAALAVVEHRVFNGRVLGLPDETMLHEYRARAAAAQRLERGEGLAARRRLARLGLELEAANAARRAVLDRARLLDGEALQAIEEEFDFEEGRLRRSLGEPGG